MLRIAIVGCGKIADSHAGQIKRLRGCELVAACDREILMARQFHDRFPVQKYFDDIDQMLEESKPDVVHITTPPETHYDIASTALKRGCHVYVEKPFTVTAEQTASLIALANERNVKITAGHDDQFGHATRRMRALVKSGFLGEGPVHMESYYCYELSNSGYAGALLGDKGHWVRRLPGKLLHNVISHGIARIAEFVKSDSPQVLALGFISPFLSSLGEEEVIDELRVIIRDPGNSTAYFTFSSQMRPALHQFRIFGTKNALLLDSDQETLIKLRGARFKSYAEKFVPPMSFAGQYLGNLKTNLQLFLARDFHMKSGMKFLIESFYRSIVENTPVPIPYREILLTAQLMDEIFRQLQVGSCVTDRRDAIPVIQGMHSRTIV